MSHCLIALGANLGDRRASLDKAVGSLARVGWSPRAAVESLAPNRARRGPLAGQGEFLNGCVLLETSPRPNAVLTVLREIEAESGRRREERWGPRTLDLDPLLYDELVMCSPELEIPHPRMAWRRFVLEPATEVAPEMVHPTTGRTIRELLEHLNLSSPYYAVAGLDRACCDPTGRAAGRATPGPPAGRSGRSDGTGVSKLGWRHFAGGARMPRRVRLLASEARDWHAQVAVSDFWLDETVRRAESRLPTDRARGFPRMLA